MSSTSFCLPEAAKIDFKIGFLSFAKVFEYHSKHLNGGGNERESELNKEREKEPEMNERERERETFSTVMFPFMS